MPNGKITGAYCYDASDGKVLWRQKIGTTHASPILTDGRGSVQAI
jgi:outer membrane protein assembly factor BamB